MTATMNLNVVPPPTSSSARQNVEFTVEDCGRALVGRGPSTALILDSRMLIRDCFCACVRACGIEMNVAAFASMGDWLVERDLHPPVSVVIFNIGGRKAGDMSVAKEISKLVSDFKAVPVVVLADTDDLNLVLKVLECGARGHIPSTVSIDVCIEAIKLALAGGSFVPASSLVAVTKALEVADVSPPMEGMFTSRQAAVIGALRRGKSNKIIAHELCMSESTVKIHIRNIMKRLHATNRTEAACKLSNLFPEESVGID
jgi:DNA-binding NarL/FixJ family response regulator